MAQKKKLQVFISSTYADLRDERQAAVEAILTAGHIPAGMELFAAGDESQMNVIKRWIDESDVYLLILGGRYGSIEPKSEKSYIQLEYEYAVDRGKPLFAVVVAEDYIEERVKQLGTRVIETDHPQKLREFRALVLTKMVRFWRDPRDIKLAVLETMAEFSRRDELVGWIPGNEAVNGAALAEEIARLTKENAELRAQLAKSSTSPTKYNGLTFEEMYSLLNKSKLNTSFLDEEKRRKVNAIAGIFGDTEPSILHLFWMLSGAFRDSQFIPFTDDKKYSLTIKLEEFGLVELDRRVSQNISGARYYTLTEAGKQFLLRLRLERDIWEAEKHISYEV